MRKLVLVTALSLLAVNAGADPLTCNMSAYRAAPGLAAAVEGDTLALTWDGDTGQQVRLRLAVSSGSPVVRDLAVRKGTGGWVIVAENGTPDFKVATGFRRATDQQIKPLRDLGVEITQEVIDRIKWEAFWDAPLNVPGEKSAHGGSTPPLDGVANQPGLPRKPEEVARADAAYHVTSCEVRSNGARIEVSFPGVSLGLFQGRLQYTVFKGTNLVRQEVIAKTDATSVAYKYEAGLKGLTLKPSSRMVWRDTDYRWQDYAFGGSLNTGNAVVKAGNRLIATEVTGGSVAAFPPPHNFFWSRETENVLGYNYYRKESNGSFAFGVRQAESEEEPAWAGRGPEDVTQNFALRSARPGTWQRMPVYFYVSADAGTAAVDGALTFTRGDHYKPLPGYQVMATHFHTSLVRRLRASGSLDTRLPDLDVMKAAGINIFAPIDGSRGENWLQNRADYFDAARRHSDKNFLIMPNEEYFANLVGGHMDLLFAKPLFWTEGRKDGEPFVENHPKYGRIYRVKTTAELIEMVEKENVLMYMPHPRSKGSTGYPEAVKDSMQFKSPNYRGVGFRWGMGVDGSETRLCEYRCLPTFDDMNNWIADVDSPPKYIQAITETYAHGHGDDVYANNPVNYVKLASLPQSDDYTPIIDAMKKGDYVVTSGEVLITGYAVEGTGAKRTVSADLEWTFPLEFVEVVWGDGQKTDRQVISATDLPAFGKKHFSIPFDATGKKWVRFAAWDTAGNGAMVQPIKLTAPTTTSASR